MKMQRPGARKWEFFSNLGYDIKIYRNFAVLLPTVLALGAMAGVFRVLGVMIVICDVAVMILGPIIGCVCLFTSASAHTTLICFIAGPILGLLLAIPSLLMRRLSNATWHQYKHKVWTPFDKALSSE